MSLISISAAVGELGQCAGLFFASSVVWRLSKSPIRRYAKKLGWMPRHQTTDDERKGRELIARMKELTRPPEGHSRSRGMARMFGMFMAALLVSWALTAVLAVHDNQEINSLRHQLQGAAKFDTWTDVAVLQVYDSWNFLCQFTQDGKPYGEPFKMSFAHDGSELKLGLDPGMMVKRLKFQNTPQGMSVAGSALGVVIHRNPATGKFIDFRGDKP